MIDLPDGLLRCVLDRPDDDGPRLVAADWWEEHGDLAHAEFIRVQLELDWYELPAGMSGRQDSLLRRERELLLAHGHDWLAGIGIKTVCHDGGYSEGINYEIVTGTEKGSGIQVDFHRGFVHEVRCRLADWVGEACGACGGVGENRFTLAGVPCQDECVPCKGAGRVGAHGPAIVRLQPVARVVTEKRPYASRAVLPGRHAWFRGSGGDPAAAAPPVFDALSGGTHHLRDTRSYAAEQDALDDLSAALLALAKASAVEGVTHAGD